MERIVIALGGNALGKTTQEQKERAKETAKAIVPLILGGNEIVICHGNGPQVGMINLAFEKGAEAHITPPMPLPECTAMSQGYIGCHLQQAIGAELAARGGSSTPVMTMLTQVVVDENDPAFLNPTKPIGDFYDEATAKRVMAEGGGVYKEDAGRGWRRVVASPEPKDIYERDSLNLLLRNKQVVIAGGGGGIPIVKTASGYKGIAAVVDKDFTAEVIAEMVNADRLFILTAVERVAINYGKPNQTEIDSMTVQEAGRYIEEGHFPPGSMLPKILAAVRFARSGLGRKALIGALDRAQLALEGKSGTLICCD